MQPLVEHLRKQLDATVLSFGYASTKAAIADHGRQALAAVVAGLAGRLTRVEFGRPQPRQPRRPQLDGPGRAGRPGPARPNGDARPAEPGDPTSRRWRPRSGCSPRSRKAAAPGSGRRLERRRPHPARRSALPSSASWPAARGIARGYSLLLDGDDDAVVRVDGVPGSRVPTISCSSPSIMPAMMKNAAVQEAVTAFLETAGSRTLEPATTP